MYDFVLHLHEEEEADASSGGLQQEAETLGEDKTAVWMFTSPAAAETMNTRARIRRTWDTSGSRNHGPACARSTLSPTYSGRGG